MSEASCENLIVYKNACELRKLIYQYTEPFAIKNSRLVSQMRAAARSVKQNIAEGYKRDSIRIFINLCKTSYGSLEELTEDIKDCFEDGLFDKVVYDELFGLAKRTDYLLKRFIDSLFVLEKEGKWKQKWPAK